mgnify:CR=1 FL=1
MERAYSIYQAKAKLSELLRSVKRLRPVIITDRGRPVARVIPYVASAPETLDERLSRLDSIGALLPAKMRPRDFTPVARRPGALRRFLAGRD